MYFAIIATSHSSIFSSDRTIDDNQSLSFERDCLGRIGQDARIVGEGIHGKRGWNMSVNTWKGRVMGTQT
jgi:hypothetical protein